MGSIGAGVRGRGKYKSVAEVIMYDMTPAQRKKLADAIKRVVKDVQAEDVILLTTLVMNNGSLQKMILVEMSKFLKNEMGLAIA